MLSLNLEISRPTIQFDRESRRSRAVLPAEISVERLLEAAAEEQCCPAILLFPAVKIPITICATVLIALSRERFSDRCCKKLAICKFVSSVRLSQWGDVQEYIAFAFHSTWR
jgi:hypothetical protein